MAVARGVDDRSIEALLRAPVVSMSRAGRNDAGHLARRAEKTKRPKGGNTHIGGADGVAVSYMTLTALDAEATGFGRGITHDDGIGRSEICSSPRMHPELEHERGKEYESARMIEFERILATVPKLQLRDLGSVSQEVIDAEEEKVRMLSSRQEPPLPSLEGDDVLLLPSPSAQLKGSTSSRNHTTQSNAVNEKEVVPPNANAKSVVVLAGGATPRHKNKDDTITASFKSPERWREPSKNTIMPPVGHYRPKYHGVETSTQRGGYIQPKVPVGANTAREGDRRRFGNDINDNPLKATSNNAGSGAYSARDVKGSTDATAPSSPRLGGGDLQGSKSPMQNAVSGDFDPDDEGRRRGPHADRHNSPVFRSKQPQLLPLQKTDGADVVYWPRNESLVSSPPKGSVVFSKQTPRPPIIKPQQGPDASLLPRSDFEGLNEHKAPSIGKMTPRRALIPVSVTKASEGDNLILDKTKADAIRYKKPTVDVDFGKMSPRRDNTVVKPSVSVEEVEDALPIPNARRLPIADFAKMQDRPAPRQASQVHVEGISYATVDHRIREAVIRPDAQGHAALFVPPITQNCDYHPNLDVVRPKFIQSHEMAKNTPRRPPANQSLDLVYDIHREVITARVKGDPHLSSVLSRERREKVLSSKQTTGDMVYDVLPAFDKMKPPMTKGFHEMGKKVDRAHVFSGRGMPSDAHQKRNDTGPGPGAYTAETEPLKSRSPKRRR